MFLDPKSSLDGASREFWMIGQDDSSRGPRILPILRGVASGIVHPVKMRQYVKSQSVTYVSGTQKAEERAAQFDFFESIVFIAVSGAYIFQPFVVPSLPDSLDLWSIIKFELYAGMIMALFSIFGGLGGLITGMRGKLAFTDTEMQDLDKIRMLIYDGLRAALKYFPIVLIAVFPFMMMSMALIFELTTQQLVNIQDATGVETSFVDISKWITSTAMAAAGIVESKMALVMLLPSVMLSYAFGVSFIDIKCSDRWRSE